MKSLLWMIGAVLFATLVEATQGAEAVRVLTLAFVIDMSWRMKDEVR